MRSEQRKHNRFIPKENAFAALGRKYTRVGKIKDISLGGLAFEYITEEEFNEDLSQIDIFLVGTEFHLYKVPCKMIYNIEVHVPQINNKLVKIFTTKRCGVQFKKLTKDLTALIKFFIRYHTLGSAPG
jgi:hypothetical protein